MDNGGVESRFGALVQIDAVEHLARGRVESKRDVREAQDGAHARHFRLDASNRFDGLDAVATRLDHAGRERQRQGIDEDVLRAQSVAVDREVGDGARRANLPFGRAGLTLFVDARGDDGRTKLSGQRQEAVEPGAGPVSLLEVHRVEDGLAA